MPRGFLSFMYCAALHCFALNCLEHSEMRFRVGQYNILGDCFADNMKPWFWYGYAGLARNRPYLNDELDPVREKLLGFGRSGLLVKFWTLGKRFFKLFHVDFPYKMQDVTHYQNSSVAPSLICTNTIHTALCDFFNRDDLGSQGDKDLAHELFTDPSSEEYKTWASFAREAGLHLHKADWVDLDAHRHAIPSSSNRTAAINAFNRILRQAYLRNRGMKPDADLSEPLLLVARLASLSDRDIEEVVTAQNEMQWDRRVDDLIREIHSRNAAVWGFEELDKLDSLRAKLDPELRLAVFKHRNILEREDGEAIFYDPRVFELAPRKGHTPVSFVRYSGAAVFNKRQVELREYELAFHDGLIASENPLRPPQPTHERIRGYVFSPSLEQHDGELFDERVCVFVVLRHIATSQDVVFACTHLDHTQMNSRHESIRAIQADQLQAALSAFLSAQGLSPDTLAVLLGDFNDAPNHSFYSGSNKPTAVYETLTRAGWVDSVKGGNSVPTTFTLNRRFPIDYIMCKAGPHTSFGCKLDEVQQFRLVGFDDLHNKILVPPGSKEAVFGPPLRACGGQPPIPSDHVPVTATIHTLQHAL